MNCFWQGRRQAILLLLTMFYSVDNLDLKGVLGCLNGFIVLVCTKLHISRSMTSINFEENASITSISLFIQTDDLEGHRFVYPFLLLNNISLYFMIVLELLYAFIVHFIYSFRNKKRAY